MILECYNCVKYFIKEKVLFVQSDTMQHNKKLKMEVKSLVILIPISETSFHAVNF